LLRDEDPKQRAGGSSEFTIIAHVVNAGVKLCRLAGSGERLNGATPKCSVVDITIAWKAVMMAGFRVKNPEKTSDAGAQRHGNLVGSGLSRFDG